MNLPRVHICIVQPAGYVHSLGFLDQARFLRHQFRRLGAGVTLAKNRLCHEAVNFVFGAHLGFDASLRARHTCVFVNLEQLGLGGAMASAAYLHLLRQSAVIDYDAANVERRCSATRIPRPGDGGAATIARTRLPRMARRLYRRLKRNCTSAR